MNDEQHKARQRLIEWGLLALILLLAGYLRLVNLTDNPGWYTDEGTHLEIAQNLAEGKLQYFAIGQSLMITARQPAFEILLAGAITLFGSSMVTLRTVTGLLGVVSVAMVYVLLRITQKNRVLPLLAAFITATHPLSILYTRLGFSYALLTPLILLTTLGLVEYWHTEKRGWLALAAASIGVGITTDLMMGSVVPVLVLVVMFRRWRDLLWSLPLVAAPFTLYLGVMLLSAPSAFLFDLEHTLLRLNKRTLPDQASLLAHNYTILLSQDFWMPIGLAGLFLMRPYRLRMIALTVLLLPIAFLGRTVPIYSLSLYYITPLLPFVTIGVAVFVYAAVPYIYHMLNDSFQKQTALARFKRITALIAGLAALILPILPLFTALMMTFDNVHGRYPTAIDSFLLDAENTHQALDYVNERVQETDLVIASPGVGWAVAANTADYQMAVIKLGQGTVDLSIDLDEDRFVFDPTYTGATFAIVDNLWRNWAAFHMPPVAQMLADIEQNWLLVFQAGALEVYANPKIEILGYNRSNPQSSGDFR